MRKQKRAGARKQGKRRWRMLKPRPNAGEPKAKIREQPSLLNVHPAMPAQSSQLPEGSEAEMHHREPPVREERS